MLGVIFDLDGVIVDTAPLHYICWKETANSLGFDIDEEFNETLKGISRLESLEKILSFGNINLTIDEKNKLANDKNNSYVSKLLSLTKKDILPGIEDFLIELKNAGIKTSIASASKNAPFILEKLGLAKYFDAIANPEGLKSKPHGDIFSKAAELVELKPFNCVGIEDSIAGIEAINSIGMYSIGIGTSHEIKEEAKLSLESTNQLSLEIIKAVTKS